VSGLSSGNRSLLLIGEGAMYIWIDMFLLDGLVSVMGVVYGRITVADIEVLIHMYVHIIKFDNTEDILEYWNLGRNVG
jgi:hypothetical protein